MNPVDKALWYIETHFAGELTLDEIAGASPKRRALSPLAPPTS